MAGKREPRRKWQEVSQTGNGALGQTGSDLVWVMLKILEWLDQRNDII